MCFFSSEEMNLVPVLDAKVKILSIIFFLSHPGNTRERERERERIKADINENIYFSFSPRLFVGWIYSGLILNCSLLAYM